MNKRILTIAAALAFSVSIFNVAFAQTTPNIPQSLEYYGFLHLDYDSERNNLKEFTTYTNTGFASSPAQVPLLAAAGFKKIVYITNHFSPGYSPLLAEYVTQEGIQLNGVAEVKYDYRNIPDYESKVLEIYKKQLLDLRSQLVANGTLDKINLFYIADEPALNRNYIPNQSFVNKIDTTFKEVFPGKKTTMAFAEDRTNTSPFRGAHLDPPPTLDVIGMDPYFQDSTTVDCSEESVRNFIYNGSPNSAVSWAAKYNKPIYLIGDAMLRNKQALPLCYVTNTFNAVKKDPAIIGLTWFIYDLANLDGGTYLSGAGNSPSLVSHIKSLTSSPSQTAPVSNPATGQLSQCVNLAIDLKYGDSDTRNGGITNGEVTKLQQFLVVHGLLSTDVYGYFGGATLNAVKTFQFLNGISTVGNVGPLTRAKISSVSGCSAVSHVPPSTATEPQDVVTTQPSPTSSPTGVQEQLNTPGAPIVTVSSNTSISSGERATISWNVSPTTNVSCIVSGGNLSTGAPVGLSGSWTTPPLYVTTTYAMKCTNNLNALTTYKYMTVNILSQTDTPPQDIPPVPTVAVTPVITLSSDTTVAYGGSTNITWNVTPSTNVSCVSAGGNLANGTYMNTSGSWTTPSLYTTTQYGMKCTNVNGLSTTKYVTVTIPSQTADSTSSSAPVITLSPNTTVAYGGSTTITWSVTPASQVRCVSAGGNLAAGTAMSASGSWTTPPLYTTTQYGMQCTNTQNNLVAYKYVAVTIPSPALPSASLSQSSISSVAGAEFKVTLTSSNANSCVVTYTGPDGGGILSNGPTTGSLTFSPYTTGTYVATATCTGTGGTVSSNPVSHTVTAVPITTSTTPTVNTSAPDACAALDASLYCTTESCTTNTGTVRYGTKNCAVDACAALDASQYCTTQSCTTNTGVVRYGTKSCPVSSMSSAIFAANSSMSSVLGASTQCVDLPTNMHRGYESYGVTRLQEFLKSKNFIGEVTGFYGDKTVAAVKEYQSTRGLPQTGMVYDFTRASIKGETCQ